MSAIVDPPHIDILLNMNSDDGLFFNIISPGTGEFATFCVELRMLQAHSLVFRSAFKSKFEMKHKRTFIPIFGVRPHTFKNMLRFVYGHRIVNMLPISDVMELFALGKMLMMESLLEDTTKFLKEKINEVNLCEMLHHSIILEDSKVKAHVTKIIESYADNVFICPKLPQVCPKGLNHVIKMNILPHHTWRSTLRWSLCRAHNLSDIPKMNGLFKNRTGIFAKLVMPRSDFFKNCSLNLVRLTEKACSPGISKEDAKKIKQYISQYHIISDNPSTTIFVCTRMDDYQIMHEEYSVKTIHDCSGWMKPTAHTESKLIFNFSARGAKLYSLVFASSKLREAITKENNLFKFLSSNRLNKFALMCDNSGFVTVCEEDTEKQICKVEFKERIEYEREFEVCFRNDGKALDLEPNRKYSINVEFTCPHPMWYAMDTEEDKSSIESYLEVEADFVNPTKGWRGSHIRYLLYRID